MEQEYKKTEINGKELLIPKWKMRKQIEKQPLIFPLVSDAVASAIMMATEDGEDESSVSMFSAALVKSIMTGIADANMVDVFSTILDGVAFTNSNGVKELLTLDNAESNGFNLGHLYAVSVEVIMENYGPLLKDGFQILSGAMINRPQ